MFSCIITLTYALCEFQFMNPQIYQCNRLNLKGAGSIIIFFSASNFRPKQIAREGSTKAAQLLPSAEWK